MQSGLRSLERYATLILKGAAYGITHIVPGIGGGLILVILGIYEQFVDAVGNFLTRRDRWREYIPFLVFLGVGMVVAMLVLSRLITSLADRYPVALAFFFMGLLVGTIPSVLRLHGDMRPTLDRVAILIAGLALVVGFRIVQERSNLGVAGSLEGTGGGAYNLVTSFIAGGASVTPGLDGTYVWMLSGSYQRIMESISHLTEMSIEWGILVPAGLGSIVGILSFSKLIDTIFKRAPSHAHYAVLGLIAGSVYGLWPSEPARTSQPMVALCFVIGALLAVVLGRPAPGAETQGTPTEADAHAAPK